MIQSRTPFTLETLEDHMTFVEGGVFKMGGDSGRSDSLPDRSVRVGNFFLMRYQVTFELWTELMQTEVPILSLSSRPIVQISWYEALVFCNRLSKKLGYSQTYHIVRNQQDANNLNQLDEVKWKVSFHRDSNGFRLPTEAEWEYAAGGGRYAQSFVYAGSPNLSEIGWWKRNSHGLNHPVGLRYPNSLGLFDMSGNVYEWVWDWYGQNFYKHSAQEINILDSAGPGMGKNRCARGGSSINDRAYFFRNSARYDTNPDVQSTVFGFRLCRSVDS